MPFGIPLAAPREKTKLHSLLFPNVQVKAPGTLCEKEEPVEVEAVNPPWYSKLEEREGIIRDKIYAETVGVEEGIKIAIACNKKPKETFTGILTPEVVVNALVFGAGSGELESPGKKKALVTGTDSLEGPAGDRGITAKNP